MIVQNINEANRIEVGFNKPKARYGHVRKV